MFGQACCWQLPCVQLVCWHCKFWQPVGLTPPSRRTPVPPGPPPDRAPVPLLPAVPLLLPSFAPLMPAHPASPTTTTARIVGNLVIAVFRQGSVPRPAPRLTPGRHHRRTSPVSAPGGGRDRIP